MTSSESPAVESPTFVRRVLVPVGIFVLGAAAAAGIAALLADEDDRPPIIVSNGSVRVDVSQHGAHGKKGRLKKDGNRWYHDYDQTRIPNGMEVLVAGANPSAILPCSSTSTFFAQKVQIATINFKYGANVNGKVTFSLGMDSASKKAVQFIGDKVPGEANGDYRVDFGGADAKLTSVTVDFEDSKGNSLATTCTFAEAGSPVVAILQRK